ncbi:hypothetical protein L1987_05912 [Smallanthus sonchifolius]|uniref:Uncharacterized protein n=1 Tax=Smallanthus sonchifolius TaxID=185202 RepID=A0ACB9JWS3_9ASTR|nr:hypothetical protein L1987_05912 [Smallanthus sonchifolius]
MFCRLSLNDVMTRPAKFTDPTSPKLTCIGQIKKRSTTTNYHFTGKSVNYTKLRKNKNHVISVVELDPPLPVVKFCPGDNKNKLKVNLGKRRGIELKTLQIQPFRNE